MPLWHRLAIVAAVLVVTAIVARLIDRTIARRQLDPGQATRYRVLRRTVVSTIVFVGILSALLVIPPVRALAGGLLASSAIVGLVVGFASQSTLSNFVAGVLIAFSQPLRLGDRVRVDGTEGTVEEIGLTYTFIRTLDDARLVIPNAKLASDTILNSTIRAREQLAQITVQVPLQTDLDQLVGVLRHEAGDERAEILVTSLEGSATVTVRTWAPDAETARRLESDLRLRAHHRLRAAGVYA
jgi:small-conductance mechanosensitive channel